MDSGRAKVMTTGARPLRQFSDTLQLARSTRPTGHRPPAGSRKLQFPYRFSFAVGYGTAGYGPIFWTVYSLAQKSGGPSLSCTL